QSSPPNIPEDQPTIDIPVDARGLPTLDALHVVLRLVERFFSSHLINTLSHFTGRFEKEAASTDVAVREEVQAESVRVGMAMLHSGSLLLE
ncbi:hypothetical protein, partial [Streptomyces fildesensis]|uniref:hypothetical protein n=1 Tax=Streptomyces fildesensis TaxID=375757 RepID=UPI001E2CECE0